MMNANVNQPSPKIEIVESIQSSPEIGDMAQADESCSTEQLAKRGIISPGIEEQDVVHAFRTLRTELLSKMARFNSVIMVSSVINGGGASFTASNLAAAFAFDRNKTVLLIDCNFKDSSLADILNVRPEFGLKDFICGRVTDVQNVVSPTPLARVRFVSSGSSEDTGDDYREFFSEKNMASFLEEVKNRYPDRVILLDAPPILDSADSKILAQLSDYILMVLPYKKVGSNDINKTLKSIDREKILGFVINN